MNNKNEFPTTSEEWEKLVSEFDTKRSFQNYVCTVFIEQLTTDDAGTIYDLLIHKKQDLLMNFIVAKLNEIEMNENFKKEAEEREKERIERRNLEIELLPIWEHNHAGLGTPFSVYVDSVERARKEAVQKAKEV